MSGDEGTTGQILDASRGVFLAINRHTPCDQLAFDIAHCNLLLGRILLLVLEGFALVAHSITAILILSRKTGLSLAAIWIRKLAGPFLQIASTAYATLILSEALERKATPALKRAVRYLLSAKLSDITSVGHLKLVQLHQPPQRQVDYE